MSKKIKSKKHKQADPEEEFNWDDPDDEDEFSWDTSDDIEVERVPIHPDTTIRKQPIKASEQTKTVARDGKGKRSLQVVLGYNSEGLNQSTMIMEIACMREHIPPDWGPQEWSDYLYGVGNIPFYAVWGDLDRYYMLLYAAEYFRQNPEGKDLGLSKLQERIKSFDPKKMLDLQLGSQNGHSVWGGVEYESRPPIREQVATQQKETIDRNRSEAVPAEAVLTQQGPNDAYLAKWVMAEKRAGQPRESWEGKCDWEFEQMIKYCYGWLKDIGEVPQPYPMGTIDLFWQRPRPNETPMDEKTVMRRNYITYKLMKFWRKSLSEDGVKDLMQFSPLSYRVTLMAKRLNKLIEMYATNWQTDDDGAQDDVIMGKVRKVALKYFKAHFPVAMEGAKPGPLATLDPPYVEYIRLCRKYQLEEGILLHEADL